jgi:transcriptional regulator of heat shock response
MKLKPLLVFCLAAAASIGAPAASHASETAPAADESRSAAYDKDLCSIIESHHTYEYIKQTPQPKGLPPFELEFVMAMRNQMTRPELCRHLQPALAKLLNPGKASVLAKLTSSEAYRKREGKGLVSSRITSGGMVLYTQAEMAELRRLDANPAIVEWRALQPQLEKEVKQAITSWNTEYAAAVSLKLVDEMARIEAELAAAREKKDRSKRTITFKQIGLPSFDQLIYVMGNNLIKMFNAFSRFENELDVSGFNNLVSPERLVTQEDLRHAGEVMDQADAAVVHLMESLDTALKERESGLSSLNMNSQDRFRKIIESKMTGGYTFFVDFGEGMRGVMEQQRKLLVFLGEHQGKYKVADGKFVFQSEEDLATLRSIGANIDRSREALNTLINAQERREKEDRSKARAKLRNEL